MVPGVKYQMINVKRSFQELEVGVEQKGGEEKEEMEGIGVGMVVTDEEIAGNHHVEDLTRETLYPVDLVVEIEMDMVQLLEDPEQDSFPVLHLLRVEVMLKHLKPKENQVISSSFTFRRIQV